MVSYGASHYHVVGIFSGVGEEIFLSFCEQPVLFLGFELLELLQLPASLGALHPLLGGHGGLSGLMYTVYWTHTPSMGGPSGNQAPKPGSVKGAVY